MNRKLVNGLLLLALTTVGCSTFTSCKDNEEGYKNEVLANQQKLYQDLLDKINAINPCTCDKAMMDAIKTYLGYKADGTFDTSDAFNQNIYDLIDGWVDGVLGAEEAPTTPGALKLYNLGQEVAELYKQMNGDNSVEGSAFPDDVLAKQGVYNTVKQMMIDVLQNKTDISNLVALLDAQITSIEVNQTYNNIFGSFNLPIGLQSNLIGSYYGVSSDAISFPKNLNKDINAEVLGNLSGNAAKLIADLPAAFTAAAGEAYTDGEENSNLGHLYMTINPLGVDFTGSENLALINSKGEEAPVTLTPEASTDLLMFGWTRSENGLYKVKAQATDVEALAVNIDENLKKVAVNALKDPSKANFEEVAYKLYESLNGLCPAYAVKAKYSAPQQILNENNEVVAGDAKENYVVTKYEVAAVSFKPLGYAFDPTSGAGIGSKRLPIFGQASDAIDRVFNKLKEEGKISFKEISINPEGANVVIDLTDVVKADGTPVGKIELTYTGKDGNVNLTTGEGALNDLIASINKAVNDEIASMQDNINEKIEDVLDRVQAKLQGKYGYANSLVSLYNSIATKVNNFLNNPNHYLQPMLAYKVQGGALHRVATSAADPTVLANAGEVTLFATSYNAEVLVPSCKKYIKVVNLADGKTVSEGLIAGRTQEYPVNLASGKYAVLYSSLDFRGNTSSNVYYVTVK